MLNIKDIYAAYLQKLNEKNQTKRYRERNIGSMLRLAVCV